MKVVHRKETEAVFGDLRPGDLFWYNKRLCLKISFDSYFCTERNEVLSGISKVMVVMPEEGYVLIHKSFLKEEFK